MKHTRLACAILLALPLIVFGANYWTEMIDAKPPVDNAGTDLLQAMRDGGLMAFIALSHIVIGVLLLVPRTRFAAALLNLPMSIGILAFHVTMLPEGTPMAAIMLLLNAGAAYDPPRIQELVRA